MRVAGRDNGGYGGGWLRGGVLSREPAKLLAEQHGRNTLASAHELHAVAALRELQGAAAQMLPAHCHVEPKQGLAAPCGPQRLHAWGLEESHDGYSTCLIRAVTLAILIKFFKIKSRYAIYYKIKT